MNIVITLSLLISYYSHLYVCPILISSHYDAYDPSIRNDLHVRNREIFSQHIFSNKTLVDSSTAKRVNKVGNHTQDKKYGTNKINDNLIVTKEIDSCRKQNKWKCKKQNDEKGDRKTRIKISPFFASENPLLNVQCYFLSLRKPFYKTLNKKNKTGEQSFCCNNKSSKQFEFRKAEETLNERVFLLQKQPKNVRSAEANEGRDSGRSQKNTKTQKNILRNTEQSISEASKENIFNTDDRNHIDYCIIGAGPAGLQLGYFLQKSGRKYVIFERSNISGSFFVDYPRHRRLISINKRFTGKINAEFELRHDWNSLLSDDPQLLFKHYSQEFFPHADSMVDYLNAYQKKLNLNVEFNINIGNIRKVVTDHQSYFEMIDQNQKARRCRYLVVATGLYTPESPSFTGSELVEGYENINLNTKEFEGKNVLILGRGNAAFETADSLYGHTNLIHMVSRSRARLAWNTHYVGDLRAVNNGLLDTYQLKSLDGLLEASVEEMALQKRNSKIFVRFNPEMPSNTFEKRNTQSENENNSSSRPSSSIAEETARNDSNLEKYFDNLSLREGYDKVIRCLGFKFDYGIFDRTTERKYFVRRKKHPDIKATFESKEVPDLYFTGTVAHSLDYRKSAGGFVHGFRYNVRALHRLLEWKNYLSKWSSSKGETNHLLNVLVKRMNEASGPYQMFQQLADVFIISQNKDNYIMLEEFPVSLLPRLTALTGHELNDGDSILAMLMEYGPNFSGPDKDTFRSDRATGDLLEAHKSNFLHPVLYFYETLPAESDMLTSWNNMEVPKPSRLHHVLEDFLTTWTAPITHILPLRRFLENILKRDLRNRFGSNCLGIKLTNSKAPIRCKTDVIFNIKEAVS